MFKTVLCAALLAAVTSLPTEVSRHELLVVLQNGEVLVEDLSQPIPRAMSVDVKNIHFFLYRQSSKESGYELVIGDEDNLRNSSFDSSLPTRILIHGYLGSGQAPAIQDPKNAYLTVSDCNVIGVDYKKYSSPYLYAVSSAKSIGGEIGNLVTFLATSGGLEVGQVHIVGHSLGAHIAGYAGQAIATRLGAVARITGLDPAGPLFAGNSAEDCLDPSDAVFVDNIHTSKQLGIGYPVGHMDFWPNGGSHQPRCESNALEEAIGACDHAQSCQYFTDSITNPHMYPAALCTGDEAVKLRTCEAATTALMGEAATPTSAPGDYYVDVNRILLQS